MAIVYHIRNAPDSAVYGGRPGPFGNPFIVGKHGTRGECISKFEEWAPLQEFHRAKLIYLKARDMKCFCKPQDCHCDLWVRWANGQES